MQIDPLLAQAVENDASDIHLQVGRAPLLRINGKLSEIATAPLTDELLSSALQEVAGDVWSQLGSERSLDMSHSSPKARWRVNIFYQQGHLGAVFRKIPEDIPTLSDIKAPVPLIGFAREARGIVLVTGPTGSGKSTTLAAMVDLVNSERQEHILTIEDPIEFVHKAKKSLINQREIGRDTPGFAPALRDALREDPDIILVGEMRDLETISIALTAAETGHLVFGTLHTSSAPSTIDRIVDAFPAEQQQQARIMLANSLVGVVSQALIEKSDGSGRVAAHEIMVNNNPVRAHIRKGDTTKLRGVLQTSFESGMQTLDRSLAYLVGENLITEDAARAKSESPEEFEQMMERVRGGERINIQEAARPEFLTQNIN
jgi:twitching motility protein PilT